MKTIGSFYLAVLLVGTLALSGTQGATEQEELEAQEHLEDQVDYLTEAPRYSFEYSVHNPENGDMKKHQESREGDSVKGSYTITEPDGSTREVRYSADGYSGFKAVITRISKDGKKTQETHGDHVVRP